jgi:hypothetical protein
VAPRDYESAPANDRLDGVNDAIARALIAKQIFNGVRLYLNATKLLSQTAQPVEPAKEIE